MLGSPDHSVVMETPCRLAFSLCLLATLHHLHGFPIVGLSSQASRARLVLQMGQVSRWAL